MSSITPVPKPKKRRRGRSIRRDKGIAQKVRERDGYCLYGLVFQDGCYSGYDVCHIKSWGGPEGGVQADVLENMLCLCRKHHTLHENGRIPDVTLQLILYHFYGYGPEPWLMRHLQFIQMTAREYGLSVRFESQYGRVLHCYLTGTWRRVQFAISFDTMRTLHQDTVLEIIRSHMITALRRNGT